MIRITVELLPLGSEKHKRHLGTATIWNDGTGMKTRGNYKYKLSKRNMPKSIWREGMIKDFARKRLGAWDLLYLVLFNAVGKRNTS